MMIDAYDNITNDLVLNTLDDCSIILTCVEPVELSYRQIHNLANVGVVQCTVENKGAICTNAGIAVSEYSFIFGDIQTFVQPSQTFTLNSCTRSLAVMVS